jgi:hypothetical protein
MGVAYATREDVSSALGDTARPAASVDRAIQAASRSVEHLTHRRFYPTLTTRYFDWPNYQYARSWRLWLDADELISVTTLTSGGVAIAAADYFLEPVNDGPPFTSIDLDLAGPGSYGGGDSPQQSVAVLGLFGYRNDQAPAGALETAISSASATTIDITDGSLIGVGDTLTIDTERLLVTERGWLTSAQTGSLTASNADRTLAVATGSAFHVGETLLIDSERLLITDIAGNNLTVKRAQAGSVLAVHTTATIYTSRVLTVVRGALGTTAATHLDASAITRLDVPPLIRAFVIAHAINQVLQESGGYSQSTGSGDTKADAPGGGLDALRKDVYNTHGRKARMRAV